jgi:tetratricopeptide (TPR) repeat protein
MGVKDIYGMDLSGASQVAAEKYQQALSAYHCFAGDPFGLLDAAIADSPGFVMAHLMKVYMTQVGSNPHIHAMGAAAFETARTLPANARESAHVAAAGALLAGEIRTAGRILEDISIAYPRDALALQAGQLMDFLLGDSRMLRDRIGRALPAWSEGMPDYHAVLGMLAFGLEETGLYDRAEAAGRRAVELQPRNGWAQHAVAHVLEMQDRRADGIAWMRADTDAWTHESFFAVHNWWHLALFHLGLGEVDEVLRLYDGPIWGHRSSMSFDMVDASAMLWRLKLLGVDLGDRWAPLADAWAAQPAGRLAFEDAHALMAFIGAGRDGDVRATLEAQAAAAAGTGDNAYFTREVGQPLLQGLAAYAEGRHARAVELLRGVRNRAGRFGGSHAQRDLIDLTLIAAARGAGDGALERALLAERACAQPLARAADRRLAA